MHPKSISIINYSYALPDEKIALFPLEQRDESKLLVYKKGTIQEDTYQHIAAHIPANSLLVFNNTRVIQARILFQKATGGIIEIFCLEPYESINDYSVIMQKSGMVKWKCMIGGAGKWKAGALTKTMLIAGNEVVLSATLIDKLSDAYVVSLSWEPEQHSFATIIEAAGNIPLPPYIKRKAASSDSERYQTIYAKDKGSVAAPTAGLHFTESIFPQLALKNIETGFVTLHVGAGTFKPVKAAIMQDHEMHAEWIDVTTETISHILSKLSDTIIATGTTSLRTLESLYWMGVKTCIDPEIEKDNLTIQQWDVYESPLNTTGISARESLEALLAWLKQKQINRLITTTQILIAPGYQFKIAKALITNFHQPQSTLLLLVAAAIGPDWEKVYQFALNNDFRFLSYGDGSLLFFNDMH